MHRSDLQQHFLAHEDAIWNREQQKDKKTTKKQQKQQKQQKDRKVFFS